MIETLRQVYEEFIDFWPLFGEQWVAGWLIALLLALVGVLVVARDQIFLGAAVSQASTFGIAAALWAEATFELVHEEWFDPDLFHTVVGGGFAVLAAVLTARASRARGETHEGITGWVFLAASSSAVLIAAGSPHGMEEVQQLMGSSTLIGAKAVDAWIFGGAAAATIAIVAARSRSLVLLVVDREMAESTGLPVRALETGIYVWLGLVVGFAIHVAGTTYAFGGLVLPALFAKGVCREIRTILVVAPAVAVISSVVGFAVANHLDFPPGQVSVAVLASLKMLQWVGAWAVRLVRR